MTCFHTGLQLLFRMWWRSISYGRLYNKNRIQMFICQNCKVVTDYECGAWRILFWTLFSPCTFFLTLRTHWNYDLEFIFIMEKKPRYISIIGLKLTLRIWWYSATRFRKRLSYLGWAGAYPSWFRRNTLWTGRLPFARQILKKHSRLLTI